MLVEAGLFCYNRASVAQVLVETVKVHIKFLLLQHSLCLYRIYIVAQLAFLDDVNCNSYTSDIRV